MKIAISPDKFKNSLTGFQFCEAAEAGLIAVNPNLEILKLPLADGGDGTLEVVNYYLEGIMVEVEVNNPFFQSIIAKYLYAEHSKTAFVEMAEASGLKLLKPEQFNCKNATTLGTGEMIVDAIEKGAKTIILGIGGSATNDCGTGMAKALGYRFLDKNGDEVKSIGARLSQIVSIDDSKVHPKLFEVDFKIACDVDNRLFGENGAAYVYAEQKGASAEDVKMLDHGMRSFSKIIEAQFGVNSQNIKGAGAAGGMGLALKVFLNGDLKPGIDLIKDLADFDSKIANADWVITGEGKLDLQTLSGKTIKGVVTSAKAQNKNVAAFCGSNDLSEKDVKDLGIDYVDSVLNYSENLKDAMENSYAYVIKMAKVFAEKLSSF